MAELGFFGIPVSRRSAGGAGMDTLSYAIAVEEIARVCASTGITVAAHTSLGIYPIYKYGTPAQKETYLRKLTTGEWIGAFGLTEPGAGSDAGGTQTTAVRDGDDWILNGSKIYITNGKMARTSSSPRRGPRRKRAREGISAFILEQPTEGFTVGKVEDKLGCRGSETVELHFQDVRLPADALLGEVNKGFPIFLDTLDGGRVSIGAMALGIAQGAFEASVEYAKTRQQFGQPIAEFQGLQWILADMAMQIEAARHLVYERGPDEGRRRAVQEGVGHGQALRLRGRDVGDDEGDPGPRRDRLHAGASGRAVLPRREADRDRRRDLGDPADGDRAGDPEGVRARVRVNGRRRGRSRRIGMSPVSGIEGGVDDEPVERSSDARSSCCRPRARRSGGSRAASRPVGDAIWAASRSARRSGARGCRRTRSTRSSWATSCRAARDRRPARQAALKGGLPDTVAGDDGQQGLRLGTEGGHARAPPRSRPARRTSIVAGGMESMSNAPYFLPGGADRLPARQRRADGPDDPRRPLVLLQELAHGNGRRADRARSSTSPARSRTQFAVREPPEGDRGDRRRASSRRRSSRSRSRRRRAIRSSSTPTRARAATRRSRRSRSSGRPSRRTARSPRATPRASTTARRRSSSPRARRPTGSGLKPLARVIGYATGGTAPELLFYAPVVAVRKLHGEARARKIGDFDLIEANEAFAAQALADGQELGWDWSRVNVNGGAVALGHPIGASGARVLVTLLHALKDRGGARGSPRSAWAAATRWRSAVERL